MNHVGIAGVGVRWRRRWAKPSDHRRNRSSGVVCDGEAKSHASSIVGEMASRGGGNHRAGTGRHPHEDDEDRANSHKNHEQFGAAAHTSSRLTLAIRHGAAEVPS